MSSLCVCLVLRASTHFLHFPPRCMDNFSRNFENFDIGFFYAFVLEKYY